MYLKKLTSIFIGKSDRPATDHEILFFWTIVAIPGITAHIKMIPVAFAPFDKVVISEGVAREIKQALEKQGLGI